MSKSSIEVSIIVPVYNVKPYLSRCIESLLKQTFDNYEIILVDDGSSDGSELLCDEFEKKHENICVVHKENGGLGSARNFGLFVAKGKYVCFVDSDDLVKTDYIEKLYRALIEKDADVSICGYEYSSGKYSSICEGTNRIVSMSVALKEFACGNALYNFAWNKLYKKEIIDKMEMLYSNRHCAEDMYFNTYYYRWVNQIAFVEDTLYVYFVNLCSLSNGRRSGYWNDMIRVYESMLKTCEQKKISTSYADSLLFVMLRNSMSNYLNVKGTKYVEFKQFIQNCYGYKKIYEYTFNEKELSKVDQLIYRLLKKNQMWLVFQLIKCSKFLKIKLFPLFCRIRKKNNE